MGSFGSVVAQEAAADAHFEFDIPAQALDAALAAYFQITGVQLLYDSEVTTNRRSSPVKGRYAPRQALALLLRGTGLVARYTGPGAAVITSPERSPQPMAVPLGRVVVRERVRTVAPSPVERLAYYGQLEQALEACLRQDRRTERLRFKITISLRITDIGQLAAVRVQQGSGDARTDRLVADALLGRTVAPPPIGIAQPLLIALRSRAR